jgi:hypothetical protein
MKNQFLRRLNILFPGSLDLLKGGLYLKVTKFLPATSVLIMLLLPFAAFSQQNAIHFDGSNDYVNCGNNAVVRITGSTITLEAWIYPTSFKANVWEGCVITKDGTGPDSGYMLRVGNSGQVNFNLGSGSWNEINSSTGAVSLNTWHHIAGTYDGTTQRLYVDGTEVASSISSFSISNTSNSLYIGESPAFPSRVFPGRIEEVRIWNITRSASEINAAMNNELCGTESGLVAYYKFNQGTAGGPNPGLTAVTDELGTSNGTLTNSSLNGAFSNWVAGVTMGNCIDYDAPCSAGPISAACTGNILTVNNTSLTNSSVASPSCASYAGSDAWFTTVVPATGNVEWDAIPAGLTDMGMSVYSVTGGCSSTFTEIYCDDASGLGSMPTIQLLGRTPGETLYIRLWDKNDDENGTFDLQCADPSTGFCVNGDATDLGSGCADLTDAVNDELGSIWDADDRLDFTTDWSYDFSVNLGTSDGGADGICFVMHNDPSGTATTGGTGGSMGASGITNSLIVEIDTYINTEDRNDGLPTLDCITTTNWDHLDIWTGGTVNPGDCSSGARIVPSAVELLNGASLYDIENGLDHTFRISYVSATQTLTATVLNSAATTTYGTISYSPVNASTLFGTDYPFFGFTGSTGGLNNNQGACLAASFLPLPVELTTFESKCETEAVELLWTTVTETDNDYFEVERSVDGYNFETVATVDGMGNSSSSVNYSWVDENPIPGFAYYRLNQVDFDGANTKSNLIASNCELNNVEVSHYQNSAGDLWLSVNSKLETALKIQLVDMSGRLIFVTNEMTSTGGNAWRLDHGKIAPGIYLITAAGNNVQYNEKVWIK